jgi:hypothetical protein
MIPSWREWRHLSMAQFFDLGGPQWRPEPEDANFDSGVSLDPIVTA